MTEQEKDWFEKEVEHAEEQALRHYQHRIRKTFQKGFWYGVTATLILTALVLGLMRSMKQ